MLMYTWHDVLQYVLTAEGAGNDHILVHVPQPRLVAAVHLHT